MTESESHKRQWNRREFVTSLAAAALAGDAYAQKHADTLREVYLVPDMHPASCGWLDTFSVERVYCANDYLNHLDRVHDDPNYEFVLSEVNNIIAIMNFQPGRIAELKHQVNQKRVELVNGNFLESDVNLSGGEALVRVGVEGLRWYRNIFGIEPRFAWNIDTEGAHEQMPQIAAGLGLDAMVYARGNPTGKPIFWSVSPDGTQILTLSPPQYSEENSIFSTKVPLNAEQLLKEETFFQSKESITPEGAPILIFRGGGDYNLAPAFKGYPREFLKQWAQAVPGRKVCFTTMSRYVDTILPGVHSGRIHIPTARGGSAYGYGAFWIENYEVKTRYRRNEHELQAAEAFATIASLQGSYKYPVQSLSDSWILMCLNMDRNTLWGAAAGMVFVSNESWDAQDRFNWVAHTTRQVCESAGDAIAPAGEHIVFFNPLNWKRNDPVVLRLPAGKSVDGAACEALPDGSVLFRSEMPPMSAGGWKLSVEAPSLPQFINVSEMIETEYYLARIDTKTGALASLKLKKTGREMFSAPANVLVAERPMKKVDNPADHMPPRPDRTRLATSSDQLSTVQATRGAIATTVEVTGTFYGGGNLRRVIRFYHDHPRIDFETELNDIPNYTIVVSEFPLAEDILEVRRGIPYGFSHGAWAKPNPNLHGWTKGIIPVIRWIDFSLTSGGGFAILDRGLTGRELNGRTPILYLLNAEDKYDGYPNPWLTGKERHKLSYSIVAHESAWEKARIPQMAWEYNREPIVIDGRAAARPQSFLETSQNIIVEAMRREGNYIELRFVECLGLPGSATIKLNLPHRSAALTDLMGRKLSDLPKSPHYAFQIRPQQIVTMHFEAFSALPEADPIEAWDRFVPENKLAALHAYDPNLIGHPPYGA